MGKDLGFDVVYRGETRGHIKPGTYVFFQRQMEHGGGYWLGQAYDDWFGFTIDAPVSMRTGMEYLLTIRNNEYQLGKLQDNEDEFFLKSP